MQTLISITLSNNNTDDRSFVENNCVIYQLSINKITVYYRIETIQCKHKIIISLSNKTVTVHYWSRKNKMDSRSSCGTIKELVDVCGAVRTIDIYIFMILILFIAYRDRER